MLKRFHSQVILFVVAITGLLFMANEASAVATAQISVVGKAVNETTLQLFDSKNQPVQQDDDSNPAVGAWWWRNAPAGDYTLVIRQPGQAEVREKVTLTDGKTNAFRVDSGARTVTATGQRDPDAINDQDDSRFAIALLGGVKRTPYEAQVQAAMWGINEDADLSDSIGMLGVEGRYYLPNFEALQACRTRLFLAAMYLHYLGGGRTNRFINAHPGPSEDTGMSLDEKRSLRLALGSQFLLTQQVMMAILVGAHATHVKARVLSDETGGGGPRNSFGQSETIWGPYFAVDLMFPLLLQQMLRVPNLDLFVRAEAMHMRDISVSGRSSFTGADYRGEAEGGIQYGGMLGIMKRF